ncbi:MAG: helicase C-terminal domain-containing protein [Lachnospiraceae bacterium]
MKERQVVHISVRSLVEFILREGDIDNRVSASLDKNLMQMGSKIHKKIQRQMGADYRSEIPLGIQIECDGFELQVEGRADGIIENESGVVIDEIKGVLRELKYIKKPEAVHLAQAKCYAYIYAVQNQLSKIGIQMTYCNMETEELKRFEEIQTIETLEKWFYGLVKTYEKWAKFRIEWKHTRNTSIKNIEFPFPYREGQKELVHSVYKTILRKKKLFIQAPTGVGKTMAALFPSIKAMGEGLGDKLFYLTAKTITRTVAKQGISILEEQNLKCKAVTLTAKDKICLCEEKNCNPEVCAYAKGHFNRVNEAVFELLNTTCDFSREVLEKQAKKHMVCPFELSLDISIWVDVIICDYNYLFDPNAYLRRFFTEGTKETYLFLIDEAHNLVERGRDMYSANLYKEEFLAMKKLVKYEDMRLAKRLDSCNKQMLQWKRECETYQLHDGIGHFAIQLMNLMVELEHFLENCEEIELKTELLEFYFRIRTFLNIYDRLDDHYVIYTEFEESGMFKLKLFCVNPARSIQECLDLGNSTIFFSATLLPIQYYKQLLSTDQENYAVYAHSSFDAHQCLVLLGTDISTKYSQRTEEMYDHYAEYIMRTAEKKRGNYLAFFPSYHVMEEVYQGILRHGVEHTVYKVQSAHMDEESREDFLNEFEKERMESLVGFCVMGGIFSEGIDLTHERLIGAFIIGTGLPQVCNEREMLKNYFDRNGKNGYHYAYLYPGMNKVLQAAGRVIRTDTDRGIILLLDQRFTQRQYQEIFPKEWKYCQRCDLHTVQEKMNDFWNS